MSVRTRAGIAAASVATLGLISGGLAPAAVSDTAARMAPTPKLTVTLTKDGHTVDGPKTFKAGRVALEVKVRKRYGAVGVIKLKAGYTLKAAEQDLFSAFGPEPDLARLMKFNRKTTFFGGISGARGTVRDGTIVLPRAGKYLIYDFGGPHFVRLATLNVTGPAVKRPVPHSDGLVVAKTDARWGGSKTLPHKGTLTFKNAATDSPHFLSMGRVARGTTRAQVLACIAEEGPCGFFRDESLDLEPLDEGKSMTVNYDLPRGTYVQLCFYPDHMTGAPHAAMGMVRIVTLK
ncbi:MAG TPA: hypothetical protein VLI04_07595 [Nocardioidaceae bacterium]|nr:hypothetical protein [Nocardioidaceae bacterium]